jgi:ribokinase
MFNEKMQIKKMENSVGVIGDYCTNITTTIDALDLKRHVYIEKINIGIGGAAGLIAQQLARLRLNVEAVGAIGDDDLGKSLKSSLEEQNIKTNSMIVVPGNTGRNIIILGKDRRTVIADLGVHIELPNKFDDVETPELSIYFVPSYPSYVSVMERLLKKFRTSIFSDIGFTDNRDMLSNLTSRVLPMVDCAVLSKNYVSEEIFNQILNRMNRGDEATIIVTDGGNGAYLFSKSKLYHIPAFKADPQDVNGAGDTFISGLMYGKKTGLSDLDSVIFSNALCATKISQVNFIPSMKNVDTSYSAAKRNVHHNEVKIKPLTYSSLSL